MTIVQPVHENDTHRMYTVQSCPVDGVPRAREIAYDKVLDYAACSCKKFESEGIPCKHILAFLRLFGNNPLPNKYIMKRWTRVAKSLIISDEQGVEISGKGGSLFPWRTKLFQLASEAIDKAVRNEESAVNFADVLQGFIETVKTIGSPRSGGIF